MTFNALLSGMFLHFGTLLLFYNNTPQLLRAIPGEKVGRWGDVRRKLGRF